MELRATLAFFNQPIIMETQLRKVWIKPAMCEELAVPNGFAKRSTEVGKLLRPV